MNKGGEKAAPSIALKWDQDSNTDYFTADMYYRLYNQIGKTLKYSVAAGVRELNIARASTKNRRQSKDVQPVWAGSY